MGHFLFFLASLLSFTALPVLSDDLVTLDAASVTGWRVGSCTERILFCVAVSNCEDGFYDNTHYLRCSCPDNVDDDGYLNGTGCAGRKFIAGPVLNLTSVTGWRNGTCSTRLLYCDELAVCQNGFFDDNDYFRCHCPHGVDGDGYLNGSGCANPFTPCSTDEQCPQYYTCDNIVNHCRCRSGFEGDGNNSCVDINECLRNPCHEHAICSNHAGGYNCTCDFRNNYAGNGTHCHHWCSTGSDCHHHAMCNSRQGVCVCKSGFVGDGVNCTDVNECQTFPDICSEGSMCINAVGTYNCECDNGYNKTHNSDTCIAMPISCEHIRQKQGQMKNDFYIIDPDFTGPANQLKVFCEFHDDYAVTEVRVLNKTLSLGSFHFDYGADHVTLQTLLQSSNFCSQFTQMDCKTGFRYDVHWLDAFNQSHFTWAGAFTPGMHCGCGELGKCDRCNCGGHESSTKDWGWFVNKSQLPIVDLRLGDLSRVKFKVDHLRCGPRVFDIPKNCDGWAKRNNYGNGPYYIDIDGPFGMDPVLVYCDLETYIHVGVTEMQLNQNQIQLVNHTTTTLSYVQGLDYVQKLVSHSEFCSQHVRYVCKNSGITGGRVFVNVTKASRQLPYFPGANGMEDSCACGATKSCLDRSLRCNCDIEDGKEREDFGDIIENDDLPVVSVSGGSNQSSNTFIVSNLQCAPKQFGIFPNCEKLRSKKKGELVRYSYLIDPDGYPTKDNSEGNVDPFLVECEFFNSPVQGITVVHHANEMTFQMNGTFSLSYLQATYLQLIALKSRSTYCVQHVAIGCQNFSLLFNGSEGVWVGLNGQVLSFSDTLTSCMSGEGCQCNGTDISEDSGELLDQQALPITVVNFTQIISQLTDNPDATANISIDSLRCSELFPTCAALNDFVKMRTHLGETLPDSESPISIDPDGAGNVQAFEVQCSWPDTTKVAPTISHYELKTSGVGKSVCIDIKYEDDKGREITPEQLLALRNRSANCFQGLEVKCQYARVHGMVNFTTCDGQTQIGWAGSTGQDSCACGVGGHCQGGREYKCNCDMEDGEDRMDGGIIIKGERLPVCQVCMSLDAISVEEKHIPRRKLVFKLFPLNCYPGEGRHIQDSCQRVRMDMKGLTEKKFEIVYMNSDAPIPVGCELQVHPPVGVLVVFLQKEVFTNMSGLIQLNYYVINITIVHVMMLEHVYCFQKVYFFCLPSDENVILSGNQGWFDINGDLRQNWDTLTDEEIEESAVCDRFTELCGRCGPPRGHVVYDKTLLPITALNFVFSSPVSVVVEDPRCADLLESCNEILDDKRQKRNNQGMYTIDPDGAGGVDPFEAYCTFKSRNKCAVSKVSVDPEHWTESGVRREGQAAEITRNITYHDISVKQIQALANVSEFCWQPVKFECRQSKLINDNDPLTSFFTLALHNDPSLAFGTGSQSDVIGCTCSLTGTCEGNHTCHCDVGSNMLSRDEGLVTIKEELPVTKATIGAQTTSTALGIMRVGDVMCSNSICQQFPRDCQEAIEWTDTDQNQGINYQKSGEFLIHPNPRVCDPFLVYCHMDPHSRTGITRIVSKTPKGSVLRVGEQNHHDYYVPTVEQIRCLTDVSPYCIQPVAYDCLKAKLLGGGVSWSGPGSAVSRVWGGGQTSSSTCACGVDELCHGADTRASQLQSKCNCDDMDSRWRRDAGVLNIKEHLPLILMDLTALTSHPDSQVNITIGDMYCAHSPIPFDECSTGYHDCSEHATCVDTADGYKCLCHVGWQGKTHRRTVDLTLPVANGRRCPDDDECTFNVCQLKRSKCVNTPGSFRCVCNAGYRPTGPTTCDDIDECKEDTHDCDEYATCVNQIGSFKCQCHRNYRGSGHKGQCYLVGTCTIFGDPHTQTFDGKWVHFQGQSECTYTAATDACPRTEPGGGTSMMTGTFYVYTTHWQKDTNLYGSGTWVKGVEVHVKGRVVKMLQNLVLIVDNIKRRAYSRDGLYIFQHGRQLVLRTDEGLEILWDGVENLDIVLPTINKNKLCGLCGNFDGDPDNDWIMGPACNGSGTTASEELFGHSWLWPSNPPASSSCQANCEESTPSGPCLMNERSSQDHCDRVFNEELIPFKECLQEISSNVLGGMIASCKYDMCHAMISPQVIICNYAQELAQVCQFNLKVPVGNWRQPDFCSMECDANKTYLTCGPELTDPTEPESCQQLRAPDQDFQTNFGCFEGCFCKPGFLQEGSRCVKSEDCGCFYNGTYIFLGDRVTSENCSRSVECKQGGVVEETDLMCGPHQTCRLNDNFVDCHCDEGYILESDVCTPDPCYNVSCPLYSACDKGECQCESGFIGDCEACHDIDECASGQHDCKGEGIICVNFIGSFVCKCDTGYVQTEQGCEDVDECARGNDQCPPHSQCFNKPGMYACMCCVGYSMTSQGQCVLKDVQDAQFVNASDSNMTCCDCNTPDCDKPGRVCGTDGITYPNVRAMIVKTCQHEMRVHPMYEGICQSSCNSVQCLRAHATCEERFRGLATCECPFCNSTDIKIIDAVCASDELLYRSECEFRAAMCAINNHDIVILPTMAPCGGQGTGGGNFSSTGWSNCSAVCGRGEVTRTVTNTLTQEQFNVTAVCFSTCREETTCERFQCGGLHECILTRTGPQCTCPLCRQHQHAPVCGQVGEETDTYGNECEVKQAACLKRVDYFVLDDKPCQLEPVTCSVAQNFTRVTDADGCVNPKPQDYGRCSGGCGSMPVDCCYKKTVTNKTMTFHCPDQSVRKTPMEVITDCECVTPEQLAVLKAQGG